MTRKFLAVTLAALVATSTACSDDNNSPSSNAQVRVVHGSPDAPAVDVLVGTVSACHGAASLLHLGEAG